MLFLGLDLSLTGSGVYVLDEHGNTVVAECLSTKHYGVERLFFLREKLLAAINTNEITLACLEGAAMHETGRLYDLGNLAGIVMLVLYDKGIPFISAAPLALKKYAGGVGKNTGKMTVMLDVFKNFGIEIRQPDICDAFVLSTIAKDYYKRYIVKEDITLKPYQSDVLKVISKSESVAKNLII